MDDDDDEEEEVEEKEKEKEGEKTDKEDNSKDSKEKTKEKNKKAIARGSLVTKGDERIFDDGREVVGAVVEVSFTGKSKNTLPMNQLSGGQKTVCALSLIFAIQRLEPAPFYLFDEVDANLDSMYRSAVANLINSEAHRCQMILTTFRPELLENAHRWYRVYMHNRTSRIDSVSRADAKRAIEKQSASEGLDNVF